MFGKLCQCRLSETQTIGKDYNRQVSCFFFFEQRYEVTNFRVCRCGLDIHPLIGNMIAGQEIFDVMRGRRPTITQHTYSLKRRWKGGPPILKELIQYRIEILFRWIPRL